MSFPVLLCSWFLIPSMLFFGYQRRASKMAEECSLETEGDLQFPLAVSRLSGGWTPWCANHPDQRCGLSTPWLPSGPCILVPFAWRKLYVLREKRVRGWSIPRSCLDMDNSCDENNYSNYSCCCESQAARAKSLWLCPLQLNVEWQCFSDDSMNSGILKILHALSAHSSRRLLLSQLSSISHVTLPPNYMAVAWNLVPAHPLCSSPSLACWLQAFPVPHRTQHILGTPALGSPSHTKSRSSPAKHQLSCNLSSGPLASPKVLSAEGRLGKTGDSNEGFTLFSL